MSGQKEIRFDGQVALITGASSGLGLAYAKEFVRRGASVMLFDKSDSVRLVTEEIASRGGETATYVGDVSSSDHCREAVDACCFQWGRLDILVNNAGLLRDHSLEKQTQDEWTLVLDVHLTGTRNMTVAVWPIMSRQHYGRIINTSSASGLYGNFGQTNYAAAKSGIVGFSRTCALEGERHGILANCIAPVALTPMTENLWPESAKAGTDPTLVSPVVAYLASSDCKETGKIIACGGGYVARVAIVESKGARAEGHELSAEWVAEKLSSIMDLRSSEEPASVVFALKKAFGNEK